MKRQVMVNSFFRKWMSSVLFAVTFLISVTTFASDSPVSLKVASDWGSGFNGQITVKNTTQETYDSWNIEFDFPYEITSIWNAKIKSHNGNHYVIENVSWNGKLNPGQSTSFGFGGKPGNVTEGITNVKINGTDPSGDKDAPPIANDNSASTEKNKSVTIDVLSNDRDPNGKAIELLAISSVPLHGKAEAVSLSSVKYTPEANFTGTDSFKYTIKNSDGKTASATVTVTVKGDSPKPEPTNGFEYKVTSDWGSAFNGNIILTNTTDKASDGWTVEFDFPYNISSIWGAQIKSHSGNHYIIENLSWNKTIAPGGSLSIGFGAAPGNVTQAPSNVKIDMHNGGSTIEDPIANDDSIVIEKNTVKTVDVLENDTGLNIKIQSVTKPQHGSVAHTDSTVTYTPDKDFTGNDSFSYTIVDANGKTAIASISVKVDAPEAPMAADVSAFVYKNNSQDIDVLSSCKGEELSIKSVEQPQHGTTVVDGGKIEYTPANNYTGSDSFKYTIISAAGLTAVGTVSVNVKEQVALNKINATYWCTWGGNTSYNVDGKSIRSDKIEIDKIDPSYNVIITAFIITENGDYKLWIDSEGFTSEEIKASVEKAKAQGRKVLVSLGGAEFHATMKTQADADKFVTQIDKIVEEYGFEGLDIDVESNVLGAMDPILLAKSINKIVNKHRSGGQDFWLTAAPEWCYIIPYTYGSGKWASHSLNSTFYKDLINDIGIENFTYIWPQTYNGGPANGITGIDGTVKPGDGMDKFLAAMAWGISTQEGYKANGGDGVFIPADKLCLGIPATEGAAGGAMTYVATPELIKSAWNLMLEHNTPISGFMNWSVDWDALNITDGELSIGYTHSPWATGKAVAEVLGGHSDINIKPTVNFNTPVNGSEFEQKILSPVDISVNATEGSSKVVKTTISVDGQSFEGLTAKWTPSDFGSYSVTAKVVDEKGNEAVKTINITVKEKSGGSSDGDNLHPEVTFVTPVNNEVIKQEKLSPVQVSVEARDLDGKVTSVVIEVDGKTFVGKTANWTPSEFGEHTITVTAIDNIGAVTTKSVDVTVQSYDPTVERKQIVGYFTQWDAWKGTNNGFPAKGVCNQLNVDYSKYTILNFSFFGVAEDGSLHGGDYRNPNIYKEGEVQEPAELLHGDVYSSWDYWLLYGELELLWEANESATEAGFVVDGTSWYNTKTGLSGQMPIPMHKNGGAKGLFQLCKENNVKLVATIGGWSMCKHISEMVAKPAMKQRFLEDCKKLINMGFDGIDIDWEFPGPFPGMNCIGTNDDFANFTALMRDIRNVIGPNKVLTAAFHCSPERLKDFEWAELDRYMDHFNMMTYDMNGGWSINTGHNSPLYGNDLSWDKTFKYLTQEQNIPAHKINMGLGFYGRGVVTNGSADLGAPTVKKQKMFSADGPVMTASDFTNWGAFEGTPNYGYIMQNKEGWAYHWDDVAKVPYLTKGNYFLSFDDEKSIQHKADYVMDNNAGGVIVWHVFGDWNAGEVKAVHGKKLPECSSVATPLLDVLHHTFTTDGEASYL